MKHLILVIILVISSIFFSCKKKEQNAPTGNIKIISPNGGESFKLRDTYKIKWESDISDPVFIQLFRGANMVELLNAGMNNTGEFTWVLMNNYTADSTYKIKIGSVTNMNLYDMSDKAFKIESTPLTNVPYIRVISPNGGEIWKDNETHQISWERNFNGLVKILLIQNGSVWGEVSGNGTTENSMNIFFPEGFPHNVTYRIRVCDASNYSIYDDSNNDFYLVD